MAKVIITISKDGKAQVEAEGWTGPTCQAITKPYQKALGKETDEQLKPEFFEQNTQKLQN